MIPQKYNISRENTIESKFSIVWFLALKNREKTNEEEEDGWEEVKIRKGNVISLPLRKRMFPTIARTIYHQLENCFQLFEQKKGKWKITFPREGFTPNHIHSSEVTVMLSSLHHTNLFRPLY